jgi:hypothetical protein
MNRAALAEICGKFVPSAAAADEKRRIRVALAAHLQEDQFTVPFSQSEEAPQ